MQDPHRGDLAKVAKQQKETVQQVEVSNVLANFEMALTRRSGWIVGGASARRFRILRFTPR
jgi:hypothetical protein